MGTMEATAWLAEEKAPAAVEKPADFMLGADPEFGFLDRRGGDLVSAADFIDDEDAEGEFGLDGCMEIAELRPKPAASPAALVANIRRSLLRGHAKFRRAAQLWWQAGSFVGNRPIGGHIHFGTRALFDGGSCYYYGHEDAIPHVVDALDRFLAPVVVLLEDPDEAWERRSGEYGALGAFRAQDHGVEYRTLGSWLTSPYVALGVLALAKVVAAEGLLRARLKVVGKDSPPGWAGPSKVAFRHCKLKELRRAYAAHVRPAILKMHLYPALRAEVDFLLGLVDARRTWFPECGMKDAWGLPREEPVRSASLQSIWRNA